MNWSRHHSTVPGGKHVCRPVALSAGRKCILLFACVLGCLAANAQPPALTLAAELYAETNWAACRLECRRVLLEAPHDPQARLLLALSETRLGFDRRSELRVLADDPELAPELARQQPQLVKQLRLMPPAADWEALCHPLKERASPDALTGSPGRWVIAFYRRQIGPVLGERCSLYPNCSEYARQAFARHGILGWPMVGDRFFREPGVAASGPPIVIKGRVLRADPLADHDFWLPGKAQRCSVAVKDSNKAEQP